MCMCVRIRIKCIFKRVSHTYVHVYINMYICAWDVCTITYVPVWHQFCQWAAATWAQAPDAEVPFSMIYEHACMNVCIYVYMCIWCNYTYTYTSMWHQLFQWTAAEWFQPPDAQVLVYLYMYIWMYTIVHICVYAHIHVCSSLASIIWGGYDQ